ncbi:dihydropyrimidinase [Clostridium botulinum]|nr:dihydropyrimidinase [Clostridium botulinum D/C]NFO98386.1 dihydropyrimidinase [Clostridium botulinum]MCD3240941.1 dihydropyrimidinase [Clostridium botulinum D/C]MCD3268395.1 dihydropyrimidinase [Clostridium botulinum D/C]MCD3300932.1 dihydropyrimidinase [Clostridium botulinum D/C]
MNSHNCCFMIKVGGVHVKKFDLVIKDGIIATSSDVFKGDIGIVNGKIADIGEGLAEFTENIIDAEGKYIFPGGIDAHTHLDMPFGGTFSSDDFESGTKAAAIGGTTTVIDFAVQPQGKTLHDAIQMWREKADNKACIDYGLHLAISQMNDKTREEIPEVIKEGYSSFKVFMTYDNMRVDDTEFMEILNLARDNKGLIGVHAENHYVIKYLTDKLLSEGKIEPKYHAESRPANCEAEAVNRAIKLAEMTKSPLYVVHNSCKEGVSEIKNARERGVPIMGETCPQYLLLSKSNYEEDGFEGSKYVMSPPLREKENWNYLWKAIKDGVLQTVATDHCPFFMEQKRMGVNDFTKIPNGAPGIELRMALMYSFGVAENRISIEKFVEVTATNVAKIFGMYPKKGTIVVGSDADLVIFDPNKKVKITKELLHENVDYTPYEGFEIKGYPVITLSRGEIVAKDGQYIGKEARGRFIKRGVPKIL